MSSKKATRRESLPHQLVGRMVKIKPDATKFLGGDSIPDYVRNADLFISRLNSDGTVMIADSNSLINISSLFPTSLEILDEFRTYHDEETECPDVSIRIFGVPSRIANIQENKKRLSIPDELIFIDERREGCVPTAMKAWSYPTDKEFTLVLQDDVELCDNFMHYVNRIVKTQPDSIISLYSTQFSRKRSLNKLPKESPYVATKVLTAQGIIMRTEWVKPCLDSWDSAINGDDANISIWADKNNIRILTTIPMTLQHIGDKSVFDPSRSMGRSEFYSKKPTEVNWDNPYITMGNNIARH